VKMAMHHKSTPAPRRAALLFVLCLFWADPSGAIPCLSGFVRDMNGAPVAGADLDFNISETGQRIITPGDNTDATGFYTVCVLPNYYDVAFAPPAGTRLLGKLLPGVDLRSEAGLELDIDLEEGLVTSGTVRDQAGAPVADVDIDVDRVEGGRLYTPEDNTDLAGAFWIVVPAGSYRYRFEPPRGSRLRGAEIDSVLLAGDVLLDVTLDPGFLFQGRITDQTGAPLGDVDVDLREFATGSKVYLANNATDNEGHYIVAAPAGEFQLRFTPARSSRLIARSFSGFTLVEDTTRDQVLESGFLVTVEILGTGDFPIAGADLDVKEAATGAKLFTPHDRTDASGLAVAALPTGVFHLIVDPPVGASYAGALLNSVPVTSDTTITIRLEGSPRVTLDGRVVDSTGAGVEGAAFGARLVSNGEEIRLANDRTLPDGTFTLDLPPLPLDLTIAPPLDSRLVGRRLEGVFVEQDTTWASLVLEEGLLVDVSVSGSAGRTVAGADLDFINRETNEEIYTPEDNTDQVGRVVVAVPAGSYDLVVTPPVSTGFGPEILSGLSVQADTTMVVILSVVGDGESLVNLQPGRPNPFHETAAIDFLLDRPAEVTLSVYDLRGRLVRRLAAGPRSEGRHSETWDGRIQGGARAPAGVYVVMLRSPLGDSRKRITLVR